MSAPHQTPGDVLSDICDGELYRSHPVLQRCEQALQIIGYWLLGNIDPAVRSRLEAINLIALFRSELLQHYSFDDILKPFVSDLKKIDHCISYSYTNIQLVNCIHAFLTTYIAWRLVCYHWWSSVQFWRCLSCLSWRHTCRKYGRGVQGRCWKSSAEVPTLYGNKMIRFKPRLYLKS